MCNPFVEFTWKEYSIKFKENLVTNEPFGKLNKNYSEVMRMLTQISVFIIALVFVQSNLAGSCPGVCQVCVFGIF